MNIIVPLQLGLQLLVFRRAYFLEIAFQLSDVINLNKPLTHQAFSLASRNSFCIIANLLNRLITFITVISYWTKN